MSTFIKLTALTRNGRPFAKPILVDVNKIVTPIIENAFGESIIEVTEDLHYNDHFMQNIEKYTVSQNLAAIDLLTNEVFLGTIITKNGRVPEFAPEALFVKSKIVGVVQEDGDASKFSYRIQSANSPEEYVVVEDLDTINA